jgi:hypothetical protein
MSGVVRAVPAGTEVDLGPLAGRRVCGGDGIVVDYFGGTAWLALDSAAFGQVSAILAGEAADPAELKRVRWDMAPFYCGDCQANYCYADWRPVVIMDDGFYDCTRGTCPAGHEHLLED